MTKDEIKDSIIQKQDELILRKCKHKPNCYIMQDWSEALDALNNTEIAFRTEDWHIAVADVYEKMQTCTCGLNKLTEDIASFKSRLAEAEEEKPIAYEWHNHSTGHCYVDYIPHVGCEVGYIKTPLFSNPR